MLTVVLSCINVFEMLLSKTNLQWLYLTREHYSSSVHYINIYVYSKFELLHCVLKV